ncbi:MAG: flavodoxin-dependent (E)-4-hydroxy-3-methylbut-2-enyl-diphosphate synthase [Candidatus Omnitrophica bacterium]|nr:flavodoxin-dependent (E)-4-hydroxy-3-methylbut-2-enyl-diphosphate synthase [Candidatus Omnitrophota bacterium]
MVISRRKTKTIKIGKVRIGASHPVAIQSMAKTPTANIEATVRQINELERAGCEIVRLAVKDSVDARALKEIKRSVKLPVVADIHFSWQLAIQAIESGVDKVRLNPGNIYKKEQVREIASAAKLNHIPIRVGVNSGSLRSGAPRPDNLIKSALDYIKILEGRKFYDIVVSLKASSVLDTIAAYRKISRLCDYPLHLGLTATGLPLQGAIKSSIAIGALLLEGIGDTIRVSLTDSPIEEVRLAKAILEALRLRRFGPEIISCPTCGRCRVDLIAIIKRLESSLSRYPVGRLAGSPVRRLNRHTGTPAHRHTGKHIKVAIMGCVVNGPGEAAEADIGVAFGKRDGLLFRKGKAIKRVSFSNCLGAVLNQIREGDA